MQLNLLSSLGTAQVGNFAKTKVNIDSFPIQPNPRYDIANLESLSQSLLQVHQLRESLIALKPGRMDFGSTMVTESKSAMAFSKSSLALGSQTYTRLSSVEEVNTAPTSFRHNGPEWNGQSVTAPWALKSTADATLGGVYDGSSGEGTLKFQVQKEGVHGKDDLQIRVYAPDDSVIETINVGKNDPLNHVYKLSNGLTLSLGSGELIADDYFEVETAFLSTSYTPDDNWTGSTAAATIGGAYDGSNGTGDLTFQVARGGEHGADDLRLLVYDVSGTEVDSIKIDDKDAIDKIYSLKNGLTFQLGKGELIKDETFKVTVDAKAPKNFTNSPKWIVSSATPTLSGTYDGSIGSGTMLFEVLDSGDRGSNDLKVRVYRPDGSTLQTLTLDADDPIDKAYELDNGLSVTFSAGSLIKRETFAVELEANTTFSTGENPIESTATPGFTGVYDGSQGTDTLTFTVTQEGTVGVDELSLDVRLSDGTLLETIHIGSKDQPGQVYQLSNGMNFSLGKGFLAKHESFTVDLFHQVPTSVDPNLAFNGTGINDPKLEDQYEVVDGAFEINGTTIAVSANDSINSVLNRINQAGLGITAAFDDASERIVLTQNSAGSQHDIVVTNDTSGFLAATKLSSARSELGSSGEHTLLRDLEFMKGVTSGKLNVNGKAVALDINSDSLHDVISRIDAEVPNVSANYDAVQKTVTLFATNAEDLTISSGGTGFFAALNIDEGAYEHVEGQTVKTAATGFSAQGRRDFVRSLNSFARAFNNLFENQFGQPNETLESIREDLKVAVEEIFGPKQLNQTNEARFDSNIGFAFDFSKETRDVFQFTSTERSYLDSRLRTHLGAKTANQLLFGRGDRDDGLVGRMYDIVKQAEDDLRIEIASSDSFVDFVV